DTVLRIASRTLPDARGAHWRRVAGSVDTGESRERAMLERASVVSPMKLKRVLKWSIRAILLVVILAVLAGLIAYWRSTNDCDRKTALVNPMKAIRFCEYGSPDVLKFE